MPGEKNLFGQDPWENRGASDNRLKTLAERAAAIEARLVLLEARRPNISTFRLNASAGSTAISLYADYPGPLDFTFTKVYAATSIVVAGSAGAYSTSGSNKLVWAVLINGVDYDIGSFFFNTVTEHNVAPGVSTVIAALPAGAYTGRVRWKVTSGGGLSTDANDQVTLAVHEF